MQTYSFLKEVYDSFNDDNFMVKKRIRRGWHTPESRLNARKGSVGSYASITAKYNNIYGNQEDPSNS